MTRTLFSLLTTLLLAALLAWFSKWGQEAVVSFFIRQTRIDLSLNLFVVILLLGFGGFYVALRLIGVFSRLPDKARVWRREQAQRIAYSHFQEASLHFLSGRYLKACSELSALFKHPESAAMARLMAAQAAQEVRDLDQRDAHIAALDEHIASLNDKSQRRAWTDIILLRRAHWALRAREPYEALKLLSQLSSASARRTQTLRAKLKAAQMAGQTSLALDTARLLARHGAFSEAASRSLLHSLMQNIIENTTDSTQLMKIWQGWNSADRADARLSCALADKLYSLSKLEDTQDAAPHSHWARKALLPLSLRYAVFSEQTKEAWVLSLQRHWQGIDKDAIARVEQLQNAHPADPLLQFLLGSMAGHLQLWGKSETLLKKSLQSRKLPSQLSLMAWRQLALMAQNKGDVQTANQALQNALQAIETH